MPHDGKHKGIKERWKGRRQSTNVVVLPNDPIKRIIQHEASYTGGESPFDNPKPSPYDRGKTGPEITQKQKDNARVRKELNDLDRAGRNPVPSPRPYNIQVTPGKWTTK